MICNNHSLTGCFAFLTANSRRGGLTRLHSFHRTTQDQTPSADVDQREQKNSGEQQQLAVKPTDSLLEEANKTNTVGKKADAESTVEPKDAQLSSVNKTETQVTNKEEQRTYSISELTSPAKTLEQITTAVTTNQFSPEVFSPDSQTSPLMPLSDITASTEPSSTSPEASLLSPFIPKKHSIEKQRPVSDLIQFGDNLEADEIAKDVVVDATPSEEVQLVEEASQEKGTERRLSNERQPSMESDQSVVCVK